MANKNKAFLTKEQLVILKETLSPDEYLKVEARHSADKLTQLEEKRERKKDQKKLKKVRRKEVLTLRRERRVIPKSHHFKYCGICESDDLTSQGIIYCKKCEAEEEFIRKSGEKVTYPNICECVEIIETERGPKTIKPYDIKLIRKCNNCGSIGSNTCPKCIEENKIGENWRSPLNDKIFCKRCKNRVGIVYDWETKVIKPPKIYYKELKEKFDEKERLRQLKKQEREKNEN